jgi:microcystin-dependent protein
MTISRREILSLSLPLAGALAAQQGRAEGASADVPVDKKRDPKTVEELIAAHTELLKELKRVTAAYYHLSRTSPPVGSIQAFAGAWPPKRLKDKSWTEAELGWLLCDGSILDTQKNPEYQQLADTLGTTYDPAKKVVKLPDLRGRGPLGAGVGVGLSERSLGSVGGEEAHILTTAEMPSHNHSITDPGHLTPSVPGNAGMIYSKGGDRQAASFYAVPESRAETKAFTNIQSTNNEGGGTSHNNMQPFLVVNWCIKFR